eukprot:CAMPEP_0184104086 /NCGR_PEP_ID=MMETSP0974-20121125/14184_1 /TAXON_ID=483370 /ORGANISM="non described non described, Strain CCMP2097" /LENGTH=32 /DNA_ID= /DNA_START= /DNA_END= /DNA_ORIENTATION=
MIVLSTRHQHPIFVDLDGRTAITRREHVRAGR